MAQATRVCSDACTRRNRQELLPRAADGLGLCRMRLFFCGLYVAPAGLPHALSLSRSYSGVFQTLPRLPAAHGWGSTWKHCLHLIFFLHQTLLAVCLIHWPQERSCDTDYSRHAISAVPLPQTSVFWPLLLSAWVRISPEKWAGCQTRWLYKSIWSS